MRGIRAMMWRGSFNSLNRRCNQECATLESATGRTSAVDFWLSEPSARAVEKKDEVR
jgi:hypothetical protein